MVDWSQARPWIAWPPLRPLAPKPSCARFEQLHREAALGQFDRRRQPGQPAADDRHVALGVALQRRVGVLALGRGGVVRVAGQFAVGAQQVHDGMR